MSGPTPAATHQDALVAIGHEKTGLKLDRLRGELAKAADSGVFYATVTCEGSGARRRLRPSPDGPTVACISPA